MTMERLRNHERSVQKPAIEYKVTFNIQPKHRQKVTQSIPLGCGELSRILKMNNKNIAIRNT